MTNRVMVSKATSSVVWKCSATPAIPGVTTAEEKATAKHTKPKVIVMTHLRALEKFLGLSGSDGPKVTSLYFLILPPVVVISLSSYPCEYMSSRSAASFSFPSKTGLERTGERTGMSMGSWASWVFSRCLEICQHTVYSS